MRLVTFTQGGRTRIGALAGDQIVDFSAAAPDLPTEMVAFLEAGDAAMATAKATAQKGGQTIPLTDVKLESPVLRPPKIMSVGLNYASHAKEAGMKKLPEWPLIFNKQSLSVTGPYDVIHRPPESDQLDYEGELAFVINKRCRRVPIEEAYSVIAGYTIINDVSVRDWQIRKPIYPHTMGKSWDTHCPTGPSIVTTDELTDPHVLDLTTTVNGEVRQQANTDDFIFNIPWIVNHLTTAFTMEAGDIVTTGTPSGVALFFDPPRFLKAGDKVKVTISGIGEIENEVIEEPVSETTLY